MTDYEKFLESKAATAISSGFEVGKDELNPMLFEYQRDIVRWALRKGRAAIFADCGMGKTPMQLNWSYEVCNHTGKPVLIVCPLAVAEQTKREGHKFGYEVKVCRKQEDVTEGINVTNYEMLEHFDASVFGGVVIDESSILKCYSGKIRNEIIEMFDRTEYKLSCTATPSPNDYMELGNQCEFLGVMNRTEMLAMYFTHDGGETSKWRLKGHAEERFWEWVATWAVVLTKPSDLGYDDDGFILPDKETIEIMVKTDEVFESSDGTISMFAIEAQTLTERRDARRNSLIPRCEKAAELVAAESDEQWLIWCDLNAESEKLTELIPGAIEVRGSDDPEVKAERLNRFIVGDAKVLVTKPSIAGWGLNMQGCHNMIFVGLSDSYEMLYQAIRRCWRYGQEHPVYVYIITSEAEGAVKANVEEKERRAEKMIREMVKRTQEILEKEIRGTVRMSIPYNPQIEMKIPKWLRSIA